MSEGPQNVLDSFQDVLDSADSTNVHDSNYFLILPMYQYSKRKFRRVAHAYHRGLKEQQITWSMVKRFIRPMFAKGYTRRSHRMRRDRWLGYARGVKKIWKQHKAWCEQKKMEETK